MRGMRWFTSRWSDWPLNIIFVVYEGFWLTLLVSVIVVSIMRAV